MDKHELLQRLEYSALAYCNSRPYDSKGKTEFIDCKCAGVQFLIRTIDNELQIAFRGTDSLKDVMTDFKFWKKVVPYNNASSKIRVHTGFINAYKSEDVRDVIMKFVDKNIEKVVIVGHSYGAALAALCALDLQYNFEDKNFEVSLFGCPRIGNRAFAKSYNKRIFKTIRVENSNDIVTKIPFKILGYKHVGIRIHVGIPKIFLVFSFNSHSLQKYYEHIWKCN